MILKADKIAELLEMAGESDDPLVINPSPDINALKNCGEASINLRLGTWFVTLREDRSDVLRIHPNLPSLVLESRLTTRSYVPFERKYILHPRSFVLGVTMEWIRIPGDCAAYVVGKSSWGRRGLIIATAAGVHPGFSGCLTLEITNLGEVPVEIAPGRQVCQLFLHKVETGKLSETAKSAFAGRRMPNLGMIRSDPIADKLAEPV